MKPLFVKSDPRVAEKFAAYPKEVKPKMLHLRDLIIKTATEIKDITELEETLKWGEPSYLVKNGSTLRMDWKAKSPGQYALYFKCTSKLVATFREIFGDLFTYEKNRAVIFKLDATVPEKEVKTCIAMTLQYHALKNKPLLGYEKVRITTL